MDKVYASKTRDRGCMSLCEFVCLPLCLCLPVSPGTIDSMMRGSYPASLRNIDGSTQVPAHDWNNAIWESSYNLSSVVRRKHKQQTNNPPDTSINVRR